MTSRLKLKDIQYSGREVSLCVRPLGEPEILLKAGATFGGVPLSVRPEAHDLFVTASLPPGDFTLFLKNACDVRHFTNGKIYTFEIREAAQR